MASAIEVRNWYQGGDCCAPVPSPIAFDSTPKAWPQRRRGRRVGGISGFGAARLCGARFLGRGSSAGVRDAESFNRSSPFMTHQRIRPAQRIAPM